MDYPRMLYPAGDVLQPYRIVADENEEQEALAAGYAQAYSVRAAPAKAPVASKPAVTDASKRRGRPLKAR